jgi:hypothetical protein
MVVVVVLDVERLLYCELSAQRSAVGTLDRHDFPKSRIYFTKSRLRHCFLGFVGAIAIQ